MSKFTRYRVFAAIVENGSLANAANVLAMSPSSVSKQLSRLEEILGVRLIDRTTNKLSVTDSGMAFYDRVKNILRDVEEAEESVLQAHGTLEGNLAISVPQLMLKTRFTQVLTEFSQLHPNIRFDVRVSNQFDDLIEGRMDFAFRVGELADSQYVAVPIAQLKAVFCASPAYLKQHPNLTFEALLEDQHLIMPGYISTTSLQQMLTILFQQHRLPSHLFHSSTDALMVDEMAKAGLGISTSFDLMVAEAIAKGELVTLPMPVDLPAFDVNLLYHRREYMPERMRTFKDFVKERLPILLQQPTA